MIPLRDENPYYHDEKTKIRCPKIQCQVLTCDIKLACIGYHILLVWGLFGGRGFLGTPWTNWTYARLTD